MVNKTSVDHELLHRKKDRTFSSNFNNHTEKTRVKTNNRAFLSDETIGHSKTFSIFNFLFFWVNQFLHRITFEGHDFEPGKNYLTIHMHTTHNQDIMFGIVATYRRYGLVTRGLVHRTVMQWMPILGYIGLVPGFRDTAVELLDRGFLVAVIPGGAEEAMTGFENAYNLKWPSNRRGFAKVAIKAETPIVPIFYENVEEMSFNPIFWFWNLIGGSLLYDYLLEAKIPYLSAGLPFLGEYLWFSFTLFSIPLPTKVTIHIGDPIEVDANSDVDEVVKKSQAALQGLIDKWQPGRQKNYWRAFQQWREDLVKTNYAFRHVTRKPGFE